MIIQQYLPLSDIPHDKSEILRLNFNDPKFVIGIKIMKCNFVGGKRLEFLAQKTSGNGKNYAYYNQRIIINIKIWV